MYQENYANPHIVSDSWATNLFFNESFLFLS